MSNEGELNFQFSGFIVTGTELHLLNFTKAVGLRKVKLMLIIPCFPLWL